MITVGLGRSIKLSEKCLTYETYLHCIDEVFFDKMYTNSLVYWYSVSTAIGIHLVFSVNFKRFFLVSSGLTIDNQLL